MDDKEKKKLERLNARYKRQNDKIRESYYRVSATLPKSAEKRIKALGLSINGLINRLVLAELDRLEAERAEVPENPVQIVQEPLEPSEIEQAEEFTAQEENANYAPNSSYKANVDLSEMQALIEAKRAEQKEREEIVKQAQEQRAAEKKAEQQAEARKIIDRILSGSGPEEDPEKEALREESIARSKCPF